MYWRHGLLLAVLIFVALGAAVLALAVRAERYGSRWEDVRWVVSWDNPLCSDLDAFCGLGKARTISQRTAGILAASWLVKEDPAGLFLHQTPSGRFWMPAADDLNSLAVVLAEQEQEVYGAAGGLGVRPGDVVIDAGAHVGLFARAALAAGASKVVTFEVTPKSNAALRRNLEKEIAEGRVVVVEKGVWHEDSVLPLVIVEKCSICNSVSHPELEATIEVPLTTIDHVVTELGLERVDFIKLDVENAEANGIRGALGTIARHRPRVAVALENAKSRIAYAYEVLGLMLEADASYRYKCGAVTDPERSRRILPEVLHFYAD